MKSPLALEERHGAERTAPAEEALPLVARTAGDAEVLEIAVAWQVVHCLYSGLEDSPSHVTDAFCYAHTICHLYSQCSFRVGQLGLGRQLTDHDLSVTVGGLPAGRAGETRVLQPCRNASSSAFLLQSESSSHSSS